MPDARGPVAPHPEANAKLAGRIQSDPDLPFVLEKAKAVLGSGLNAGSGYGEVWIRDLNTFIELALQVQDSTEIRRALLVFFHFQGADGNIIDGYIPAENASVGYDYIESASMPQLKGHKNTVETDQESSLVQAIFKYVEVTGDRSILRETIEGKSVLERLQMALDYVLTSRFNTEYGLVWGATTVDWGDVQPEHEWGVEFDRNSHRAIDIYDNAMAVVAIEDLISMLSASGAGVSRWSGARDRIRFNVRRHLWDVSRHKFRPHIYLDGSPFPEDFEEGRIYYHGGTAIAIEAGFLTRDEIALVLQDMRNNVRFAQAASIGLTVFPVYPAGYFKNPQMQPYSYQNGGDWSWFGGRMVQQLIEHGFIEDAYTGTGSDAPKGSRERRVLRVVHRRQPTPRLGHLPRLGGSSRKSNPDAPGLGKKRGNSKESTPLTLGSRIASIYKVEVISIGGQSLCPHSWSIKRYSPATAIRSTGTGGTPARSKGRVRESGTEPSRQEPWAVAPTGPARFGRRDQAATGQLRTGAPLRNPLRPELGRAQNRRVYLVREQPPTQEIGHGISTGTLFNFLIKNLPVWSLTTTQNVGST